MQAAYDFDFGNIELIPAEIIQMIYVQMVAGWHPPQVLPGHQLMYFDQLRRVSQTISYAHEHNFGHGEFDWADFLLKVGFTTQRYSKAFGIPKKKLRKRYF